VSQMLKPRVASAGGGLLFPGGVTGASILGTYLNRLHARTRESLKLPADFVIHSLRHTMLSRLGEAGADAFTIMKIAGHSSVTVSQRYVHPSPESLERAFERLEALTSKNQPRRKLVPTASPTVGTDRRSKASQLIEI
jgi:integrase